jgi:hypothetical protein
MIQRYYENTIILVLLFVHFLLAQKTNQKRAPEMTTSILPFARYTSLIGATVRTEVRTPDSSGQAISGLPAHNPNF